MSVAVAMSAAAPAAWAGTANAGIKGAPWSNPIARVTLKPYEGSADSLWTAYASAHGLRRTVLGHLALEPRALFIGSWIGSSGIKSVAQEVVQDTEQGDPNVLTQFGTFELSPWEGAWSGDGQWNVAGSEAWYKGLAAGIGTARALVILQIDLPFAAQTHNQQPETIDAYGTKALSADPHTTVYIDGGAYGWLSPSEQEAAIARRDVDGYVWASQPWDVNGGPFNLGFALNLGANGEF